MNGFLFLKSHLQMSLRIDHLSCCHLQNQAHWSLGSLALVEFHSFPNKTFSIYRTYVIKQRRKTSRTNAGRPRFRNQFSGRPNPLESPKGGHDHPSGFGDDDPTDYLEENDDDGSAYIHGKKFESIDPGVVVNGIPVRRGKVPWQALIEDMNSGEICGGSVLNRLFILTAAHCVDNFRQSRNGELKFPKNILVINNYWEWSKRGSREARSEYVYMSEANET